MATKDFPDDTFLARWLAGELNEEELRKLKARPDYPGLQKAVDNLGRMEAPKMDTRAGYEALKAAREQRRKQPQAAVPMQAVRTRPAWLKPLLAVAATVALVLAAWWLFPTATPDYYVDAGMPSATANLEDGSTVEINAASSLNFSISENQRSAELVGEAYFDVAKSDVPFLITTELGEVSVVGTSFNVYSRGDSMRVSVNSGRVKVKFSGRPKEFILEPGQAATLTTNETANQASFTEEQDFDWRYKRSVFINQPLQEVLDELGRQYDLTIVRPATLNESEHYDITFPNDQLGRALTAVFGAVEGFTFRQEGQIIYLTEE